MTDIIFADELTSYLRIDPATDVSLYVQLANGLVTETITGAALMVPDPIPTKMRTITLEVAARAWRNPEGLSTERIDDYAYSRPDGTREAGVYLTSEEEAKILGLAGTPVRRAGSIKIIDPRDIV